MSQPDEVLVSKCKRGDMAAFDELIGRYQDRVYNLAYRLTSSHDDASDMAQEAFLRVYVSLSGFRGRSAFSTWLYRVVSNVCLDELRRRGRRPLLVVDRAVDTGEGELVREVVDPSPGPDEHVERRELGREIQKALAGLGDQQRLMVILRDIDELSYQEIAEILSLPLGTVKSRLSRARQALRDEMLKRELLTRVSV